ncbi:MAG: PP0621 family protein [Gallionellaceae bacterium]|nr:PP0621 family protein [Gallionellaceae bacterium]
MAKLILIVLVTIALVLWFKHMARPRRHPGSRPEAEDMVRCRVCGVNLPRSEALLSQGRTYCCEEHRRRDLG